MGSRVEIDDSWRPHVEAGMQQLFEDRLGPDIAGDAARYAPRRTGALAASVEHHIEGGDLIVSASGGGVDEDGNLYVSRRPGHGVHHHVEEEGRTYAAYVELGHRVYHPSTGKTGPDTVAPQPFLRPALYKDRDSK
jgi:hypothetical protein